MTGRLGMTGLASTRGDREIYKGFNLARSRQLGTYEQQMKAMGAGRKYYDRGHSFAETRSRVDRGLEWHRNAPVARERTKPHRQIRKSEPLATTLNEDQTRKLIGRVGARGPLPKTLSREQRMSAYEARYLHSGGHKAQHWQHRATAADNVRGAATATGVLTAGALLTTRMKRMPKRFKNPRLAHHIENTALGSAVTAGAAGLAGDYSRKRRAAYTSAPGGVAASALRRMREYSP